MPYAGIFFLFVLCLSVKQQLSPSYCFVRATAVIFLRAVLSVQQVSVPLQNVWCPSGNCSLSFPFRSSCITFFRTPVVCCSLFVVLFFLFLFTFFLSFFYGLAYSVGVLVPGTLRSTSLALPWRIATVWFTLFHIRLWPQNKYPSINRMNQHGTLGVLMPLGRKGGLMWRLVKTTHTSCRKKKEEQRRKSSQKEGTKKKNAKKRKDRVGTLTCSRSNKFGRVGFRYENIYQLHHNSTETAERHNTRPAQPRATILRNR